MRNSDNRPRLILSGVVGLCDVKYSIGLSPIQRVDVQAFAW
jgi:hypothetical protein